MTEFSNYPNLPILLVDDEPAALMTNEIMLNTCGINNIVQVQDSRRVLPLLENTEVSAIFLDLNMPHIAGDDLLPDITESHPEVPVIILTGANSVDKAVKCMKAGAFDYMLKPVEEDRMVSIAKRAIEWREIKLTNTSFNQRIFSGEISNPEAFSDIITKNRVMFTIFQYVESIAPSTQPVLITGETGVGKELIARAVHTLSNRKKDFLAENVAGLDDNIISDTLFGHVKGAFTGADKARDGLVEKASGGTLLLDEIGDLGATSQVKLLRLLQEREYFALGSDVPSTADVRIVATTNRSVGELQADKNFRNDLFYRLKTHHVHIPALRERLEDLPLLVDHFLQEAADDLGKTKPTPPDSLQTLLATYHFPGNIRELRALVFDAVSKHRSKMLSLDTFKSALKIGDTSSDPTGEIDKMQSPYMGMDTLPTLKQSDHLLIEEAMKRAKGNQSVAARLLGITPSSLNRRLKREESAS